MAGWTFDKTGLRWHYTVATSTITYVRASCGVILRAGGERLKLTQLPDKARTCSECLLLAPMEY